MMSGSSKALRSRILGNTLKNSEQDTQKYRVLWGLPVLSSDAISSVAYASEEILLVLIPIIGIASYKPLLGISGAIIALLFILVFCYRQVIDAYPQGGGAYSVAKHDLGRTPSLVAASALIIDYILTIAVSACAGTAAITSALSFLLPYKVELTIFFICLLTLGNLRGVKESSVLFGIPTYFFIVAVIVTAVVGIFKIIVLGQAPIAETTVASTTGGLTLFLILRAFSSGCSALTGVEAVSNSVPNFKQPAQQHAKKTLMLLGIIVMLVFGSVSVLAALCQVTPSENVTVVAQIAIAVFGSGSVMFYIIQASTAIILLLAANTAYNGLPQLLSILAADAFVPRRFGRRGTRLVFSNGILFATVVASLLVLIFQADVHLLIPLYSVGVFLSFTISQVGMVRHWFKTKQDKWKHKAFINGIGALVTGVVCIIIIIAKFSHGAWIVLVAIALLVALMKHIKHHYLKVADDIAIDENSIHLIFEQPPQNHVIVPVDTVSKAFIKAFNYANGLGGTVEIFHVSTSPAAARRFRKHYEQLNLTAPLIIENTPYRNVNEVLLAYIDKKQSELKPQETLTIVLPRLVTKKWWHYALHNQTSAFLETALLERRDIAVVAIPYIIK